MEILVVIAAWYAFIKFFGEDNKPKINNYSSPPKPQKTVTKDPESEKLKRLLEENKVFFDNLLKYPLTHDQRVSILDSRKRNLVLASAGCGKTSVLISKLAYLHFQKGVPVSNILLLAFNSSVRSELKVRLKEIGIEDAEIHTFHSFGKSVLEYHKESIALDKHANEDTSGVITTNFIRELIFKASTQNPDLIRNVLEFRALCRHHSIFKLAKDMNEFRELMQSFPYKRSHTGINEDSRYIDLPVLGGEFAVKSQQEWLIANWFKLNGIKVKYESPFPNVDFKYTPDFYIPEADLWIEHFAINRDGSSPFPGYVDDANRKKELHEAHKSNFACTYSYEYYEDTIIEKLESILRANGIEKNPLSNEELQKLLDSLEVDTFYRYISEMLKLIKANIISKEDIIERLSTLEDKFRANRFKAIILPIFETYEKHLQDSKTIDFEDMILKAVSLLKSDKNNAAFKYSFLLIDEFQDLSRTRYDLLNSLLNLGNGELFGVGDDWQSINRFTGADVSITLEFDDLFKYDWFPFTAFDINEENPTPKDQKILTKIFSASQTHRCSQNISKLASSFITKNPSQWKKDIVSNQKKNSEIKFQSMDAYNTKNLITLIKRMSVPNQEESIFILYPFNRLGKEINFEKLDEYFPKFKIQHGSIHRAKGLEADHVILIGMDQGPWGFPMLLGEDPLRDAFLPASDVYEYSEERRVFYVAMTRAKDNLIICNNPKNGPQSRFVDEIERIADLEKIPYEILPIITDNSAAVGRCPACVSNRRNGFLLIKTKNPKNHTGKSYGRKFNAFLGCSLFHENKESHNFCDYMDHNSPIPCPACLKKNESGFLSIHFNDRAPKVRLECDHCSQVLNYYDFHK